jgi:hypothetical protein
LAMQQQQLPAAETAQQPPPATQPQRAIER